MDECISLESLEEGILFFSFRPHHESCRILDPQPRVETVTLAMDVES